MSEVPGDAEPLHTPTGGIAEAIAAALSNGLDEDSGVERRLAISAENEFADVTDSASEQGRRPKLWQIDSKYYCSLLGVSLDLSEVRELSKKLAIPQVQLQSDYELHHHLILVAGSRTRAARRLHRYLEGKFAKTVRSFSRAQNTDELREAWMRACEGTELGGAYWAVLTHPALTPAVADQALERVHMLSHSAAAQFRRMTRELERGRARVLELEQAVARERAARRRQLNRYRSLKIRLQQVTDESRRTSEANPTGAVRCVQAPLRSSATNDSRELELLRARLVRIEHESSAWRKLYRSMGNRVGGANLEGEAEASWNPDSGTRSTGDTRLHLDEDGLAFVDLEQRRVACVGGRGNVVRQLRAVTERLNGRFLHHDGGLEQRPGAIDESIVGADIVIVALDCVSHDATRRLKRHSRRLGKNILWIRSASVATFELALRKSVASTEGVEQHERRPGAA